MPRVKRKAKAHRGYSDGHINELLTGRPRFGRGFGLQLYEADLQYAAVHYGEGEQWHRTSEAALVVADAEAQHAWDDLRGRLLLEWVELRPCCRPWAWWRWDSAGHGYEAGDRPASEGVFLAERGLFLHDAEASAWAAMTTDTTAGPDDGMGSPWHEVAHYDDGHVNFLRHVAGVRTDEETT